MAKLHKLIRNKLKEKLLESSDRDINYGCVMVFVKFGTLKHIQHHIDKNDIYEKKGYGLEDEPHVTLLYGLHDNVTHTDVESLLDNIRFGTIIIDTPSLFINSDYDVLKFEAAGQGLRESNDVLTKLPHTNTYPEYNPHLTIAYLKSGTGQKYVDLLNNNNFNRYVLKPLYVVYSYPDGNKIKIDI